MDETTPDAAAPDRRRRRHSLPVRLTHWINVVALFVLLGSGLQIFNAHPALYWGHTSTFAEPWAAMTAEPLGDRLAGFTKVGPIKLETTGLFGLSDGQRRGFPAWATLPSYRSLADGRRWHFFFAWVLAANGVIYLAWGLASGHFRRDLAPGRTELSPRHLWAEIVEHARLRFPKGAEAHGYNSLQKLAYLAVIFVLLPLMVLSGLGMSPGVNAAWPWTFEIFGGRQSARTIHFITATLIVAFVIVHLAMVLASGPIGQMGDDHRRRWTRAWTRPHAPGRRPVMTAPNPHRRRLLSGLGASLLGLTLAGCDQLNRNPAVKAGLARAEGLTQAAQRLILSRSALAREFEPKDISRDFRANGTRRPGEPAYQAMVENGFSDWRLQIDGLVERPLALSLDDLRARPARTQITRHDCVEGWSCIGQWTGARLLALLDEAGLKREARYIVFHCADRLDPNAAGDRGLYYESIDLVDAFHEQTILAYEMNGQVLPVAHGAPLRLRVERQLGYKHAKYVMRIEAVESFAQIAGGQGGFWEDRGYEWYAGI